MSEPLELVKRWLERRQGDLMGSQGSVLGVDIGSYGLRAVVADLHGQQLIADNRPLPTADAAVVVDESLALVRHVLEQTGTSSDRLLRVGIGFGGPVDGDAGTTRLSHRARGWEGYPLVDRFEEALGAPTLLDNDANVIALAESTCGAGSEVRNVFYLHLSSGVGGGLVVDGRLYHGATTTAGEIGHAIVSYDGPPCSCGAHGHLESFVSVDGLLRRANELGLRTDDLDQIYADGEVGAQVITETTELLGMTMANVVNLLDPDIIVVGGIVARRGGDSFIQAIRQRLEQALPPTMARPVPVVLSTFGYDSVAVGGLALAVQSLQE